MPGHRDPMWESIPDACTSAMLGRRDENEGVGVNPR
jgi:hypothetical protein